MKTILIATDFSEASQNASLYGVELARMMNAKVILFSAYNLHSHIPSLNVSISPYGLMRETQEKLKTEADFLRKLSPLAIEIVCESGLPEFAISGVAKEKNADIIIIGMKGSGKNIRKIFGSTVTRLSKMATIPIFVIPEEVKFKAPGKILLASDKNVTSIFPSLNGLIEIIRLYKAKLFILKVIEDTAEENFEFAVVPQFKDLIPETEISFQFRVNENVSHALNEFIESNDINWLVMIPHKHIFLERLLNVSETKRMIFHTHIPLLILPELCQLQDTSTKAEAIVQA